MDHVRIGTRGTTRGMLVTGVALGVLLLGGCGASDTDASGSSGGGAGSTSTSRYSPLEEFLNPSSAARTTSAEDYAAKDKQVQEAIAGCMIDQGFDYTPFVYPTTTSSPQPEMDWGSRAWTEKYGYGVSTMDQSVSGSSSEVVDPNQKIMEAMSPGEQEAYSIALYGGGMSVMAEASPAVSTEAVSTGAVSTDAVSTDAVSTEAPPVDAVPSEVPSGDVTTDPEAPVSLPAESVDTGSVSYPSMAEQGCWGQAQAVVYGDQNTGVNSPDAQAQFQPMWDAYSAMYSQVESDPRVTATVTAWKDCMSTAGHPGLAEIYAAQQEVSDKWSALNGWDTGGMIVGSGGAVMSTSMAATSTSPSAPAPDKIAAFKEYEITLALADWDCKDSSAYASVSDDVRIELEKTFLEEHRSELEQYRDLMNSGG